MAPNHHDEYEGSAEAAPAGADPRTRDLSNDYLNHYSEALMLIELSLADPDAAADLAGWEPMGYETYFAVSPLRRAPAALSAYAALSAEQRSRFEELTDAMDALTRMAILALRPPCEADVRAIVVEATGPALRRLIDRAASFLNSGGEDTGRDGEVEAAQAAIDRIIERAGVSE